MTHTIRYVARTDRGLLRANNQDSVFAGDRLLVVADGMGGHVAGDTASRLAVAAFAPLDEVDPAGKDLLGPLENATHDGNNAIAEMVVSDPDLDGMGTTVTALLFDGKRLGIAHVGDSRAYLWRGGMLSQITHDDTFVQSLIDEGRITEEEAAHHPQRSLLLRALNGGESEPTLYQREAQVGDRYLICSDGLSGVVSAEAIADTLASYETAEAADRLIELALRGGGPDNVTVIVADVLDTGENAIADESENSPLVDADATGPLGGMTFTRRMERIALPKEPTVSELAAQAQAQAATAPTQPLATDNREHIDLTGELDDHDYPEDGYSDESDEDGPVRAQPMRIGPPPTPAKKWKRWAAVSLAVVVLLVVGGFVAAQLINSKYYVGDDNGTVTIFQGVDGSFLGIDLASAEENSCMSQPDCEPLFTADLVESDRQTVYDGIPANDLETARSIVMNLDQMAVCSTPGTGTSTSGAAPSESTSSTSTSRTTSTSVTSSGGTSSGATSTGSRTTTGRTTSTGVSTSADGTEGAGSGGLGAAAENTDGATDTDVISRSRGSSSNSLDSGSAGAGDTGAGDTESSDTGASATDAQSTSTSRSTTSTSSSTSSSGSTVIAPETPGVTCRAAR